MNASPNTIADTEIPASFLGVRRLGAPLAGKMPTAPVVVGEDAVDFRVVDDNKGDVRAGDVGFAFNIVSTGVTFVTCTRAGVQLENPR